MLVINSNNLGEVCAYFHIFTNKENITDYLKIVFNMRHLTFLKNMILEPHFQE